MYRIWKYTVPIEAAFDLQLPVGARLLTVQTQADVPQLWALVDDEAARESVEFLLYGTDHPAGGAVDADYIGTFQLYAGTLVFHLFRAPTA